VKLLDVTAPWIAAKIPPQSPASVAPMTMARRLSRLTGMLITSAARGSSRSARQARRSVSGSQSKGRPSRGRARPGRRVVLLLDRGQGMAEEVKRSRLADPARAAREADSVDHGVRRVREREKRPARRRA